MKARNKLAAVMVGVAVIGGAVAVGRMTASEGATDEILITPRAVERRTLTDELSITGEVRREETQTINSPVDGKLSSVEVDDGQTVNAGDALFALDGRLSVAVDGDFAFFRQLEVGSDGPDVRQLERILVESGYPITSVDSLFTEETRSALADWQVQRGYGGARPESDESITVSLSANSAGYEVGKANTIGYTIGPSVPPPAAGPGESRRAAVDPPPTTAVAVATTVAPAVSAAATAPVKPTVELRSDRKEVSEGEQITLTVSSDVAPSADLTIDLTIGGDATGGADPTDGDDYAELQTSVVLPAGQTSLSLIVAVFTDQVIEDAEDLTVSLTDQFGNDPNYVVGPTNQARVVIKANGDELVPVLTLDASTVTLSENQSVTFSVTSTVESNRDLDFTVAWGGSAVGDSDYVMPDDDAFTIAAGDTTVDISVQVKGDDVVENDETLTVSLLPRPDADPADPPYLVGEPGGVTVRIESDDLPEMRLVGGGYAAEGDAVSFRIEADAPVTDDTSINYQVGGTAQAGSDYEVLTGTVIMKAGASRVSVTIRTLDDDVVFLPSDMLVAAWPARVGTVEVDEGEFVLQGSPLLSLTEPTFTITLAVSPSDRAELEVGQAVDVRLEAGDQSLAGVISVLDDAATVGDQGEELYEGTVQVEGEFAAVDGASVTIDVVLDEAVDALVVPVASVVRTAAGDEVRTVNDAGTITRVPVTIGLIDGEWVEIAEGLTGDELVVIDVDAAAQPTTSDP